MPRSCQCGCPGPGRSFGVGQVGERGNDLRRSEHHAEQFCDAVEREKLGNWGLVVGRWLLVVDRQIIGNFQPKWEGGITNRFSYKGFDLSIVIYARVGMKVLVPYLTADGGANGFPFFMQGRVNQLKVNYWTRTNPSNEFQAPDAGTDRPLFASTVGYQDGSFVKCRSINFGYELPSSIVRKVGANSLRVYVTAVNPFIIYYQIKLLES